VCGVWLHVSGWRGSKVRATACAGRRLAPRIDWSSRRGMPRQHGCLVASTAETPGVSIRGICALLAPCGLGTSGAATHRIRLRRTCILHVSP